MSFLKENFEKPIETRNRFRLLKLKGIFYFDMFLVCSILLLLFTSSPASAGMQILGKWDFGPTFDVAVSGNYLYVTAGEQILIYNISTQTQLDLTKWKAKSLWNNWPSASTINGVFSETSPPDKVIHMNGGLIMRIVINGTYLYVSDETNFSVINISDPKNAVLLSYISGKSFIGITFNENNNSIAYVASDLVGVDIVDISNKNNIKLIKTVKTSYYNHPSDLAIKGNYLYVAKMVDNGIDIIDISNSSNASVVGNFNVSYNNWANKWSMYSSIKIKGNYAYAIEYHQALRVLDLTNPLNPTQVAVIGGVVNSQYNYNDIKLVGNYAYVSERYKGANIIDISSPTMISEASIISRVDTKPGYSEGIFAASLPYGNYIFLSTNSQGVQVINSTNKLKPVLVSNTRTPAEGDSIVVKGNYAYYGGRNTGIWVVNVSDPANPKYVAIIQTGGRTEGMVIQNDTLFASGMWNPTLVSIDISNPENPVILQSYRSSVVSGKPQTTDSIYPEHFNLDNVGIAVDNYLYGNTYTDWDSKGTSYVIQKLAIYDITNKKNIFILNRTDLGMGSGSFVSAMYGDNYLLGGGINGLFIINISNRTAPKVAWSDNLTMYGGDVKIVGDIAYVATASRNKFIAYNISNPTNPVQLGVIPITMPDSINILNNTAYLFTRSASYGFKAVDIKDPTHMRIIQTMNIGGDTYTGAMVESNGKLYSGSGYIISTGSQPPTTPDTEPSSFGDLNNDGKVDKNDLIIIGLNFAEQTKYPYPSYDLDMNGVVNVFDAIKIAKKMN